MLTFSCILDIYFTWTLGIIILCIAGLCLLVFYLRFLYLCSRVAYFFPFLIVQFLFHIMPASKDWFQKVFLSFYFLQQIRQRYFMPLKIYYNFLGKLFGPGNFLNNSFKIPCLWAFSILYLFIFFQSLNWMLSA